MANSLRAWLDKARNAWRAANREWGSALDAERAVGTPAAPGTPSFFTALRTEHGASKVDDHLLTYMAVAEIERFALLKERIGYSLADRLTTVVCDRLRSVLRDGEVGRAGRTTIEFAFRARSHEDARAKLIAASAAGAEHITVDGIEFHLHLVIGAAHAPNGTIDASTVDQAEAALAEAQRQHLRLNIADAAAAAGANDRLALVRDLQQAAGRGELTLLYQPKLRSRTWEIDSVEALLRWQHPTRGNITPDIFIPLAEETGSIRILTEWVVRRALADRKILAEAGYSLLIDVNLSGHLTSDLEFTAWLLEQLGREGGGIGFEVTETATIRDPDRALSNLTMLADSGARISIDDYGSGFSSLAYLQRLPLKELKIDRSFISSLASTQRDPLLVRSTIDLAHAMELEVTAEGVDTAEALALLRVMGCDLLQGFLISPPLNVADLQDFICTKGQERARDLLPSVGKRFREQTGSLRASESRS